MERLKKKIYNYAFSKRYECIVLHAYIFNITTVYYYYYKPFDHIKLSTLFNLIG